MRYLIYSIILLAALEAKAYYEEFPISIAPGDQLNPDVTWDGENFWVVWADGRSGEFEIYGARVTPAGEVLDTAGILLATHEDSNYIMPSVTFGDSIGCVTFYQPPPPEDPSIWYKSFNNIGVMRFQNNGELIDTVPKFLHGMYTNSSSMGDHWYAANVPIIRFGKSHFFLFLQHEFVNDYDYYIIFEVSALKEDSIVGIADLPGIANPCYSARRGTAIWNGGNFYTVVDYTNYTFDGYPHEYVKGYFILDSLISQLPDTVGIRTKLDFPVWNIGYRSERDKELAYSGTRYLLISETGADWDKPSKIWFDVLSDSGLPIDSLPTIIDSGDSVDQIYPTCTYKDDKFFAVWQNSISGWTYLYGIEVDTLGQIGFSSKLPGFSNKIHPSITTGAGKLLLVWADDRNGNWDIYGAIMDSLVAVEEKPTESVFTFLKCSPNPFIKKTVIRYSLNEKRTIYDSRLTIHDVSGRLVRTFPINDARLTINELIWNGKDDRGNLLPTGIYFCTLATDKEHLTTKLVFLR